MVPADILKELYELTAKNKMGVEALYEAEIVLARAENNLDKVEAKSFLANAGSVADRNAVAKMDSADSRLERDLAKAQVNRIRTKLRVIESTIMAQATMSKIMQAEMKL